MLGLCHIHRRIESQERKSAVEFSLGKPRLLADKSPLPPGEG